MKDLIKAAKDIEKTMENLSESSSRQTDTFNNHFRQTVSIMGDYAKQMQDSNKVVMGASRSYAEMEKTQKRMNDRQQKYYDKIEKIEERIIEIRNDGKEDGIALDQDAAEKRIEQLNYEMTLQMKQAKKVHDYEANLLSERATERESRYKEFQELTKNHKKNMERMGAFGKNQMSMAKGGDIGGMASGGLDSVGAILKQLGGVGGKLGMVATALGATVGLLGVFVALMFEADKKAKDMNKNFLAGASGLDLMGKNFKKGQLTKRLFDMREMAFDVGMQFRMSADDVATLASSFNQFGLRYDEMASMVRGTDDPIRALEQNLTVAITKSKMLGVEANTVAEQIAQMNENFAMDLSQIEDAFSAIYMSAQTTGIATQKFFAMITQVTGGMSLLNVDFAQTAAIAGELVESLGEAAGSKFLGDLANRGRSKSYQDRMKSSLLAGGKTSRIGRKGLEARMARIQESAGYRDVVNNPAFQQQMATLDIDFDPSRDIMQQMGKMTQAQQRTMIGTMGTERFGGDPALARQMSEMMKLGKAVQRGDSTVQMGSFNAGENLAQMLAEASRFADLEKGESLSGMNRMVLEQITGRSGGELDEFVTMVDSLQGNLDAAQSYGDLVKRSGGLEEGARAAGFDSVEEMQTYLKENFKLALNKQGELMSSETGELVDGVEGYAIHMGDSMKDSVEQAMSIENAMTSEIVKNTASASAVLENVIGKYLNKISGFVEGIYEWLFDSKKTQGDERRAKDMVTTLSDEIDRLYNKRDALESVQSDLGAKVKSGKASEQEKRIYAANEQARELLDIELDAKSRQRTAYQRSGSYSGARGEVGEIQRQVTDKKMELEGKDKFQMIEEGLIRARDTMIDDYETQARNVMGRDEKDIIKYDKGQLMSEADLKGDTMSYIQPLLDQGFTLDEIKEVMGYQPTPSLKAHSGLYNEEGLATDALYDLQNAATNGRGANASSITPTLLSSGATGDVIGKKIAEGEVLAELNESQIEKLDKVNELGHHQKESLDSMVTSFSTLGKDTEDMKAFQEKGLPPAIGKEVMKAMVAEKLFDIAGASGMSLERILEAQRTQNDGEDGNDIPIGSKIDAEITKLQEGDGATKNADRIAELQKQKANLKTLGLKDAAYIDGKMYPQGEGAIITTPDGTSYQTKGNDNMLIGTEVGKGGGASGQTIVMNVDKVITTARNGAELADSLMKEMKRNPNTKKRIRRSKN